MKLRHSSESADHDEPDDNEHSNVPGNNAGFTPVPAAVIRTKITDLDGPVTTQQILDHLIDNAASPNELATVATLEDREWDDYNQALAAASSGFTGRHP